MSILDVQATPCFNGHMTTTTNPNPSNTNSEETTVSKPKTVKAPKPCQCLTLIPGYMEGNEAGWDEATPVYQVGCGATTSNRFAPGHDAKTKSVLIHLYRANQELHMIDGGLMVSTSPMVQAANLGWEHFLVAKPEKARAARKVQPKPVEATKVEPTVLRGQVKVGRWVYDASQATDGNVTVVNYAKRDGSIVIADAKVAATFQPKEA